MHLHVVSFDIPYPANYGGVIVIYNQIKALHQLGVKVILHCFQYGNRTEQGILEKYCHEVNYYPRSRSVWYQIGLLPFIMRTRKTAICCVASGKTTILFCSRACTPPHTFGINACAAGKKLCACTTWSGSTTRVCRN
ncbi:MAG: hypothetical protein IPM98_05510 [Lewinellaceae bacterium]|nr:hypothetical protein [Lewinellaceae bacterium]